MGRLMTRIAPYAAWVILFCGIASYVWNLPVDVGLDVPDGKLNSLSFAPFREGQSPILEQFPTADEIDEDMALLSDKTHSIRTYASSMGLKGLPEQARRHGLEMIQGAWIGSTDKDNRREIEALVEAANNNPDVVKRVIVGNEVLLRGELKPAQLVKYIREVKQRVKQPVSYADVWSMYMKYPDLIKEVDFITIHILPYWEDEPISVEKAPGHIERIYKQVRAEADRIAPGKRILIGESGWPAAGKQRGWSVPSVVNEAAFIRGLLKVAAENGFDVNIVEAFNQAWKSELEGVVGANWGLISVDREEVFPLTGKVYENAAWFKQFLAASVLTLAMAGFFAGRLGALSKTGRVAGLLFIQILSMALVWQIGFAWFTSFDNWQRLRTVAGLLFSALVYWLMIGRAVDLLEGRGRFRRGALLASSVMVVMLFSLYKTYVLAVEGRYISFPFEFTLVTLAGLAGLFAIRCLNSESLCWQELSLNRLLKDQKYKFRRHQHLSAVIVAGVVGLLVASVGHYLTTKSAIADFPAFGDRLAYAMTAAFSSRAVTGGAVFMTLVAVIFCIDASNRSLGQLFLITLTGLFAGETIAFFDARDFVQAYPGVFERLVKAITFTFVNGQLLAWTLGMGLFATTLLVESSREKSG
jgi:exo-beta-1,3-glucanase (GH17 family)